MQVWEMNPEGGDLRQLSRLDADIEGFGISPRGDKAWYVRRVQVCDRKSSDVYKDMPHSKARIYDDLMSRHWDYWDEGWYRHIFVADFDGDRITLLMRSIDFGGHIEVRRWNRQAYRAYEMISFL